MIPTIGAWIAANLGLEGSLWAVAVPLGIIEAPLWLVVAIVALLVAGVVLLYWKWGFFSCLMKKTWNMITGASLPVKIALALAFSPIAAAIAGVILLIKLWNKWKDLTSGGGQSASSKLIPTSNIAPASGGWAGGGFAGNWLAAQGLPFAGFLTGAHRVPGAAGGGNVTSGGLVMVGEQGRELVHLPQGATVTPNTSIGGALAGAGGPQQPIVINLMLRERTLEQVVVDVIARRNARR
jgi:hypothetical protein